MAAFLPILIIMALAAVGVAGDYFIKVSGNGPSYVSYPPLLIGMMIYALTAIGWFYVMKHVKLGTLGVFYALTTIILLAIVGAVFFKEQLTVYDIIGIVLGVISIVFLARFG